MKKTISLVFALVITLSVYAQSTDDYVEIMRSVLTTEKKVAIADAMQLTDSESGPFWLLYKEYNDKMYTIQNTRVDAIKEYSKNYESLSNEKADELWNMVLQFKTQSAKLEKTYYKKFKKIIPAGKAARYFQAENKIAALVAAQLAVDVPLIETK